MVFLESLFECPDLRPRRGTANFRARADQRCGQVRQYYFPLSGTERAALQNFSLTTLAGKLVAITGLSGAGTSTLLKLLARFCDRQEGRVTPDGADLRKMLLPRGRELVPILFRLRVTCDASVSWDVGVAHAPENIRCATSAPVLTT